ncbi:uncharacterized protein LOC106718630 [Papilio machaon]|uniref:uncharacterized protein LOC106718630 n=1 Tax=Papilio machaon TaxID=76193 RepID=UPI001E6651E4|nr:uncharacterized protein LOC106718630 [Papilio machaon]
MPTTRRQHQASASDPAPEAAHQPSRGADDIISRGTQAAKEETPKRSPSANTFRSATARRSCSSSSSARRKQLELKAEQAKAEIRMQLIDKQLEADLAQLEEEEVADDVTESRFVADERTKESVREWLDRSQGEPCAALEPRARTYPTFLTTDQPSREATSDVQQLAHVLKEMMTQTSSQREDRLLSRLATPRDLPEFHGDYVEWLHFKNAYEESTKICKFSDSENLWRLRRSLRGAAKEAVADLLIGNTVPSQVMDTLELRFGRSDFIVHTITTQLKKLPPLPLFYQSNLVEFSTKIINSVATLRALKKEEYLRSPELINAVIFKLPSTLLSKWTDYAYSKRLDNLPKLTLLAEFLKQESQILLSVGTIPLDNYNSQQTENKTRKRHKVFNLSTTDYNANELCKFCNKSVHKLTDCRIFRRALRRDRWKFVKSQGLCFVCLHRRHTAAMQCNAPPCDVDKCGLQHHRLLHFNKGAVHAPADARAADRSRSPAPPSGREPPAPPAPESLSAQSPSPAAVGTVANLAAGSSAPRDEVLLKVVRVKLRGPSGIELISHALLDDGASVSVIDANLADQLGLVASESSAVRFVDAFGIEVYQADTPKVTVDISSTDSNNIYNCKIQLRKVSKLNLPMQNLSVINNINCKHLTCIKGYVCKENVIPKLLIGEDNYHIIAPLQIISGSKNEPYATRCRLGWSIHGYSGRTHTPSARSIFYLAHSDGEKLNELITNSFAIDSIGISPLRRENKAHIRAVDILDKSFRKVDEQYEVCLPFKSDEFTMPDSYDNALSRMISLNKKFNNNRDYANRYSREIKKLFDEGYAREIKSSEQSSSHVWYLPHFGVQNPNKPGKLRLVFDAAAKLERGSWKHGVVSAAHAGEDGRVRCVDVQTRTGVLKRPVTRVALLEV